MNKVLKAYIGEMNVDFIYSQHPYSYKGFFGDSKVFEIFDDIIENNRKVLLYPDCDPDGLMSVLIMVEMFKRFKFTNYKIVEYPSGSHSISYNSVTRAIMEKFDYMIIMDVGSNNLDRLTRLSSYGVKTVVIDHHAVNYKLEDYPSRVTMINSTIENTLRDDYTYNACGGSMTFMLCAEYLKTNELPWQDLSIYALVALYADSVNMMNVVNIAIYRLASEQSRDKFPLFIKHFMNNNTVFCRRFISFQLVPKINAMFRTGNYGLINQYMFHSNTYEGYQEIVEQIKDLHDNSRSTVAFLCDIITKHETDNFVFVNLAEADVSRSIDVTRYTGLVANSVSDETKKPCVVISNNGNSIKGSFRDCYSRGYLDLFKQICDCDGHPSAFGIHMSYFEVNDFIFNSKLLMNSKVGYKELKEPIMIEDFRLVPDKELVDDVAWYNEFSGIGTPKIMIRKKNKFKQLTSYYKQVYRYQWGDTVVESRSQLVSGSTINIEPVYPKRLIVQTRGGLV